MMCQALFWCLSIFTYLILVAMLESTSLLINRVRKLEHRESQ